MTTSRSNAWMFLPASLGLDPDNYGKSQFYRDIRSNVRLITPDFSLEEIDSEDSPLFSQLRRAVDALRRKEPGAEEKYEYHIKMFAAIFKSAVRDCIPAASSASLGATATLQGMSLGPPSQMSL